MNIFLAITLYNDKIHGKCSESILKNSLSLIDAGHTVMPLYNSDLYIDRSRNLCVDMFMKSNCDEMVFIDSDMEFDNDAILKLIKHDKDIVAGAYRYKKDEIEFTVRLDFSRNNNCKDEETGLVYVDRAPTGLMRIQRRVFDRMRGHYSMVADERGIYSYFDTGMRFPDENNWYGEDSYFCKRFIEMGGIIMCDPTINFTHIGTKEYKGSLHDHLMGRRVDRSSLPIPEMFPQELERLKELASRGKSIVEIGAWRGTCTKELLKVCEEVTVVDHFKGSGSLDITSFIASENDIYEEFKQNVGEHDNLTVLRGSSVDMAKKFNGKMADMVFIDAGHEYEEIKEDIEAWLPKTKKIIAGHDYGAMFPGVKKAVHEKFDNVNVENTIWWVEL